MNHSSDSSGHQDGFEGGQSMSKVRTAGGHEATTSQQPAFPDFHRKLADPSGFAWLALGSALTLYAVNVIGSRGIELPNAISPGMLALGATLLTLATIFEFLSGRTFACTMFGVFSAFFGGFVVLHVSWFGITGSYDGVKPNTYAPTGSAGSQLNDLQGLWISTFVIYVAILFLAATRQSGSIMAFLGSTEVFFVLQMVHFFRGSDPATTLAKATGAFSFLSGIIAWYNGATSLLTSDSAFFTLPTFDVVKSD